MIRWVILSALHCTIHFVFVVKFDLFTYVALISSQNIHTYTHSNEINNQ